MFPGVLFASLLIWCMYACTVCLNFAAWQQKSKTVLQVQQLHQLLSLLLTCAVSVCHCLHRSGDTPVLISYTVMESALTSQRPPSCWLKYLDHCIMSQLHARFSASLTCAASVALFSSYRSGETPVLISSTVVEVGIDEPEASVMLVENADRFGLAQLHQLRGRVGRGSRASRCFLIAPAAGSDGAAVAVKRLRVLEESHNGLVIAQADLEIRCDKRLQGWSVMF
jgi:hypothetical protein